MLKVGCNNLQPRRLVSFSIRSSQGKNARHSSSTNQVWRTMFEEQFNKNNLSPLDWYKLDVKTLDTKLSNILTKEYNGSLYSALYALFPEHNWYPWKFQHQNVPSGYWKRLDNQRKFFDWLAKELGLNSLDDWYSVLSQNIVTEHGGWFIRSEYKGSAVAALLACYPEHTWFPWRFSITSHGFWKHTDNHRKFFDWTGSELGITQLDDWYKHLSVETMIKYGGSTLLRYYNSSPVAALLSCYPEHNWIRWKFQHCAVPRNFWDSPDNLSRFLSELSDKLEIQTLDDWYRVDVRQLQKFGASHIIQRHGGLFQLLRTQFPHHPWNVLRFSTRKKAQRWLVVTLRKLLPNEEIVEDYHYPKAFYEGSKRPIQLDVFIPSKSLAIEYQGEQHFQEVHLFGSQAFHQERDNQKRSLCDKNNIKLVEVPFWWNRTPQTLKEMVWTQAAVAF